MIMSFDTILVHARLDLCKREKGESTDYQHFLFFPQFKMFSIWGHKKLVYLENVIRSA